MFVLVTVMCVLLHVCMLRECEGDGNDSVEARGVVVSVSGVCDYMRGTRGSVVVYSADDVLEMSVVRGVRRVDEVCEMCMCLARVGWVVGGGVSG